MKASKNIVKEITNDEMNIIPNYDGIFNDDKNAVNKKKSRFFYKLLKLNMPSLLLSCFIYIFQSAPVYILPIVTSNVIDLITKIVNFGISNEYIKEIILNSVILVVSLIGNVPFTMIRYRVASKALRKTSAGIRSSVVRKLQSLSLTYYKKMENGKIQSKYLRDTDSVDGLFNSIFNSFSISIVTAIISIIISVYKNGYVSLFFLFIIPINVWLTMAFRKKIKSGYSDYRHKTEDMSTKINTMVDMMQVTKSHGLEKNQLSQVDFSIKKLASSGLKVDKMVAFFGSAVWVVNQLLAVVNLAFCCYLAIIHKITVGEIVLFQSMFSQINGNITALVSTLPTFGVGIDAMNSISEIMNITDVEANIGKLDVMTIDGNVRFENVSYAFPDGDTYVVKDFSLNVNKGECIAVVGSSGSGKTTLMNMIIGFLLPTKGCLYIDDKSIRDIDLTKYRHNISVVPQNSILFSGTIRENITYGLDTYTEEQLSEVVKKANIEEFIKDMPKGLDTVIGEHGEMLSGGQKQRITIARALIRNPKILILDEATSALDNISEYHVQKAIASSIKGRTTFIVAHRLSTIRNADRIIVMENGVAIEIGTYDELMKKKGKFFELKTLNDMNMKIAESELKGE